MRNDEQPEGKKCDLRDIAYSWVLLAVLLAGSLGWSGVRALVGAILPLLEN
jgi:hypothetical protein